MKLSLGLAMFCLVSALGSAERWSGVLVDARCFDSEERNVNPTDTMTYVDRDRGLEIDRCQPGAKTRRFEVVQQTGMSFRLDPAGDAKAAELIQKYGKKSAYHVTVTGPMDRDTVKVESISLVK